MKRDSNSYQTKSYMTLYLFGIGIGCIFSLVALAAELHLNQLSFTAVNLILLHQKTSLNYIIDLAPFVFGVFTYATVRYCRKNEAVSSELLGISLVLESEKHEQNKLDHQLSEILEKSPISYVIINTKGLITYVNPATKQVLGSADTVNQNILEFSTVKNSPMEKSICSAMEGHIEQLSSYHHISATTSQEKYLNIVFMPLALDEATERNNVLMISLDMTNEMLLLNKIEESYLNLTKGLANALDAKDQYTSYHSANVRFYTELILEGVNLSSKEKADIITAAELHDIGKIGISDNILHKNGQLSAAEFEEMKRHPAIGASLFVDIDEYQDISSFIKFHHERVDGNGYPDGLKDAEIPIGAAIICVADAYDAMTTDRSYKNARSRESALQELIRCKGTQFEPEFVDILVNKIRASFMI